MIKKQLENLSEENADDMASKAEAAQSASQRKRRDKNGDSKTKKRKNKTCASHENEKDDFYLFVCPFFHYYSGKVIKCEGFISGTTSITRFRNLKAIESHRKNYCETFNYKNCNLCKALLNKYDQP